MNKIILRLFCDIALPSIFTRSTILMSAINEVVHLETTDAH